MSLQFKFSKCESNSCKYLTLKENTGQYHPTANPGGWGGDIHTTSVTILTILLGVHTLIVPSGLNFQTGQQVTLTFNGSKFMSGTVTTYNVVTGSLEVNIVSITGAGVYNAWDVDTTFGNPDVASVSTVVVTLVGPDNTSFTANAFSISEGGGAILSYSDFGYANTFLDGAYTLTTTLTINGTDYVYTQKFFLVCNIKCCIFSRVSKAVKKLRNCPDCREDVSFELLLWARWKDLMIMAAGCDIVGATTELAKLQEICGQNVDCGCS